LEARLLNILQTGGSCNVKHIQYVFVGDEMFQFREDFLNPHEVKVLKIKDVSSVAYCHELEQLLKMLLAFSG
jgi:hypothetical protein